jgi:hypothetical protein
VADFVVQLSLSNPCWLQVGVIPRAFSAFPGIKTLVNAGQPNSPPDSSEFITVTTEMAWR